MNEQQAPVPQDVEAPHPGDHELAVVSWAVGASLLSFLVLTHAGVVGLFAVGLPVSALLAPGCLLAAVLAGDRLARRDALAGRLRLLSALAAIGVVVGSGLLAAAFFDMSWDGQWYHQTAVYEMAEGWNPVHDPMHGFIQHLEPWVRHYAKGPWYTALAVYQTTGDIEAAKLAPWVAAVALLLCVFAAGLDLGLHRRWAALVAVAASLNPVVVCELATYQVDGLLVCYLLCFIAAFLRFSRRPGLTVAWVATASVLLCVNTKFTGLVYLAFFAAAAGLYLAARQRHLLLRYAAWLGVSVLVGVVGLGFNPYVTNTLHRGHPFYPLSGTERYPSMADQGQDPIERYETPHNMMGRSRLVRHAYALFGRPGAQPFYPGQNARLMWPFAVRWQDFAMFYFLDVRIGGFGPLFSGIFLLSLVPLAAAFTRPRSPRLLLALGVVTIVASLSVSVHTWWPRYGPQLWWLPILGILAGLGWASGPLRWTARAVTALLLVNAALIAFVHLRWEVATTRALGAQLAELRDAGPLEVDFQYFYEADSRRLRMAGVDFVATNRLRCADPIEIISVPAGYPMPARACKSSPSAVAKP
jgi:hypothetical protein